MDEKEEIPEGMKLIGTCGNCALWTEKKSGEIDGYIKKECLFQIENVARTIGHIYPPENYGCRYWKEKPKIC